MTSERSFIEILKEIWETICSLFKPTEPQYSLEGYLEILNPVVDDIIIESQTEGLVYRGGTCNVIYLKEKAPTSIQVKLELMFQRTDSEKWIRKSIEKNVEEKRFTVEALAALKEAGNMSFEISAPQGNVESEV